MRKRILIELLWLSELYDGMGGVGAVLLASAERRIELIAEPDDLGAVVVVLVHLARVHVGEQLRVARPLRLKPVLAFQLKLIY